MTLKGGAFKLCEDFLTVAVSSSKIRGIVIGSKFYPDYTIKGIKLFSPCELYPLGYIHPKAARDWAVFIVGGGYAVKR